MHAGDTSCVTRMKSPTTRARRVPALASAAYTQAERTSCCWMFRCGLFRRTSITRRLHRGEHSNSYPRFLAMKSSASFDHSPRRVGCGVHPWCSDSMACVVGSGQQAPTTAGSLLPCIQQSASGRRFLRPGGRLSAIGLPKY